VVDWDQVEVRCDVCHPHPAHDSAFIPIISCDDLVQGTRGKLHDHLVYGTWLGPVQHGGQGNSRLGWSGGEV
jgi:hypothetical protein